MNFQKLKQLVVLVIEPRFFDQNEPYCNFIKANLALEYA